MTDDLLCTVQRPSRYLGNEINLPRKDWRGCRVRMVLGFPDVYEVGMSHPGFLLLYEILNQQEWIGAERVFAPWIDMEARLRSRGKPLVSLESSTPLALFDLVGFSLQYELSYTNVLAMLELGGIPPVAAARGRDMPLVIGGGPCAFNPEPVAPFFDAFALGDAEELILEIARTVDDWKTQGGGRLDVLKELARLEGIYIPEFFTPHYGADGRIGAIVPRFPERARVRKRILANLDESRPPSRPLVPCANVVHDRLSLEVVRGCTRGCRFCLAGFVYRPVRERSPQEVLELMEQCLSNSGYDELSLLALSIGDYSCIGSVLRNLMSWQSEGRIAVSLPSLRVGTLDETMVQAISKGRKTGFTLAPEAGSDRLRRVINKGITESDLLDTVQTVYTAGWQLLKLYFMMGLPTETSEDREALVELSQKVWRQAARYQPGRRLNVSVSTFVPKPHTPFQWEAQLPLAQMERHLAFFRQRLRKKGLQFKWHQPWQSMLEGVLARGDRRLAEAILRGHQLGCRFDGWSEQVRPDLWRRAFAETGVDPSFYSRRTREPEEILPWSHLDCGVSPGFLWKEYERALAEIATADCRVQGCVQCGVCDHQKIDPKLQQNPAPESVVSGRTEGESNGFYRYGLVFAKTDRARFLGHLEMVNVFTRAIRRAEVPLAYSQGYRPSPRISLGDALPLGIESRVEEMKVVLRRPVQGAEIQARLNEELPAGLEIVKACEDRQNARQKGAYLVTYEAHLPGTTWPAEGFRLFQCQGFPPLRQRSKRGEIVVFLEKRLLALEDLEPEKIRFTLLQGVNGTIRVRELLAHIFGLSKQQILKARIVKVACQPMEG
ncbi:MAG: TIGR03960 family B12-binding radical SAM protein [Syntrophobacteria bacterium]